MVDQLGIEPGRVLQELEQALLTGTDAFEAYRRGTGLIARPAPAVVPAVAPASPPTVEKPRRVPAQLPAAVRDFTGRARALCLLDDLLDGRPDGPSDGSDAVPHSGPTVATVTGPAGSGETALAVHWAHRAAGRFPDGCLFIELCGFAAGRAVEPVEALAAALYALGVPGPEIPADEARAAARYRTELAGRRVLVLLDDARRPEQVRPLLPGGPARWAPSAVSPASTTSSATSASPPTTAGRRWR
ncbi:hypothetical protein [Virgisporangium aurantiacum]|uniref:NB-ARC domain-containing protein n=1 Tax=Virgisporangium aurantiacum TaxID=175570 RepID=A0A8J3ZBP5_9ACTN|nr:hypothetical protein [Virgisporangium aurantiacum]GIJ61234.1 hypothetical protein Vau01_087500 [Virgisporangium aurantiacum]